MIYEYPTIEVQERDLLREVENVWRGYRTCYSNNVDFFEAWPVTMDDLRGNSEKAKKVFKTLGSSYIESRTEMSNRLKKIAETFNYNYNDTSPEEEFNSIVNLNAGEFLDELLLINACKWIAPKIKQGHESPFEHGILTFTVRNCSRSLTHQLVRHRVASFSQASQRYISENPDNLDFVIPREIRESEEAFKIVQEYLSGLPECIKKLKDLKIKNEDIRCLYPNAITTNIQVTMNFRELKHFFELRLSKHAQDEIRHLAFDLLCYVSSKMPFVWNCLKLDI